MFPRSCFLVLVTVLLLVQSSSSAISGSMRRHRSIQRRRALPYGVPSAALPQRRGTDNVEKAQQGNLYDMKKYVEEMMQMNKDWQNHANDQLKNGQTPDEFQYPSSNSSTSAPLSKVSATSISGSTLAKADKAQLSKAKATLQSKTGTSKNKDDSNGDDNGDDNQKSQSKKTSSDQTKSQSQSQSKPQSSSHPKASTQSQTHPKSQTQSKSQATSQSQSQSQPQHQQQASTTKSQSQQSQTSSAVSSVMSKLGMAGQQFHGDMTYFDVGLGACGWTNTNSDFIVAASAELFQEFGGNLSNGNPICGKKIRIYKNGKQAEATVADECPPCSRGSIDMSPSLFKYFEDMTVGRTDVAWEFE